MEGQGDDTCPQLTFVEQVTQIVEEVEAKYESKEEECRRLRRKVERLERHANALSQLCEEVLSLEGRRLDDVDGLAGRKRDLRRRLGLLLGQSGDVLPPPPPAHANDASFLGLMKQPKVAERILSFLSVKEMKLLSGLSKGMLQPVRDSDEFLNRVQFTLSQDGLESGAFLQLSNSSWKNVSLKMFRLPLPHRVKLLLWNNLFGGVESLKLCIGSWLNHPPDIFCLVLDVFEVALKLKTLELDVSSKVKELEELISFYAWDDDAYDVSGRLAEIDGNYFVQANDPNNIVNEELSVMMAPPQLKSFSFLKELIFPHLNLFQILPAIVVACQGSLEELQLHSQFWEWDGIQNVTCPKLKRLKVTSARARFTPNQRRNLELFLQNQPALEELDMTMRANLTVRFLQFLARHEKLANLKKLHLKMEGVVGIITFPFEWSLLEMSQLKEFSFVIDESMDGNDQVWYGSGEDILKALPPTLEKIELDGVDYFWRCGRGLHLRQENDLPALLSRFHNLKELSLKRCSSLGAAVTEWVSVIQEGSLGMLTQLTHLEIEDCGFISSEDILRLVVRSNSLRTLKYCAADQVLQREFLFTIVRDNPKLEALSLSPFTFDCDCAHYHPNRKGLCRRAMKKEAKRINPKLKVLELNGS